MKRRDLRAILLAFLLVGYLVPLAIVTLPAAENDNSLPSPPIAKKIQKVTEINGQKMVDNYYWLRDKQNPDVRAYLEAENAHTDSVVKPTEPPAEETVRRNAGANQGNRRGGAVQGGRLPLLRADGGGKAVRDSLPRKMTARLQAANSSGHPILLRTSSHAGHGIGTSLDEQIEQNADVFSFLFDQLGVRYGAAGR